MPISPTVMEFEGSQETLIGRVVMANSITLTPGTVSVEIEEGEILVHAITRAAAEGLAAGEMDRRIVRVEGR
jgi:multicomponent Na+:H+ antiporter subunit E